MATTPYSETKKRRKIKHSVSIDMYFDKYSDFRCA